MLILCSNFKLLFYLRKRFKYLFLFISIVFFHNCQVLCPSAWGACKIRVYCLTCILKNTVCSQQKNSLYLKQMGRRVHGLGQNVRQRKCSLQGCQEGAGESCCSGSSDGSRQGDSSALQERLCRAWEPSALWCCRAADAPGHSFHELGGTGLLQLAGEDGDWFLAFVFLADLSVTLLCHHFLFPLAAPAPSLKRQPWNSL